MTTTLRHPKKVELLRDSIDVSGKRLLEKGTADEKIDEQIDILLNVKKRTPDEINAIEQTVYAKIDTSKSDEEVSEYIKAEIFSFINLTGTPDNKFWRGFGSAPYYQKHENKKKKPGVGMDTIFGNKFQDCHSMMFEVCNMTNYMFDRYKEDKKKKSVKKVNVESTFKGLDDLEENLPVKKINAEADKFWNDDTKELKERFKVFEKYGEELDSIHEPEHRGLCRIFNIAMEYDEGMYAERHEIVNCLEVVKWWVNKLVNGRCKISYNDNQYHPKIKSKKRNYKPSQEAIDRLYNYYALIIMGEGTANFELDW